MKCCREMPFLLVGFDFNRHIDGYKYQMINETKGEEEEKTSEQSDEHMLCIV